MPTSTAVRIIDMLLTTALAMLLAQPAVQQEKLTRKELKVLIASAKMAADHKRIAAYYRSEAQGLEAKERDHEEELAESYRNPSRYPGKYPTMGDHCRSLAGYYRMATERPLLWRKCTQGLLRKRNSRPGIGRRDFLARRAAEVV